VELSDQTGSFEDQGFAVTAVVYESPELISEFEMKFDLAYPMLSDPGSVAIRTLGIFNGTYEPESKYYGVPYPGVLLIDSEGTVRGKFAEESYRDRPNFQALIDAAARLQETE